MGEHRVVNKYVLSLTVLTSIISLFLTSALATPQRDIQERSYTCSPLTTSQLQQAVVRELGEYQGEWRIVSRCVDLNGDGRDEVIAWVPTLEFGGTGGYPLLIFRVDRRGYRLIATVDPAWTPLVMLRTSKRGWRDLMVQEGGGGAPMEPVLLRYNGRSYTPSTDFPLSRARIASGQILIRRDWAMTPMGPIRP